MALAGKTHTNREYEAELVQVRNNLLRMVGQVKDMIGDSVTAVLTADSALARRVIEADHEVNRTEVETDDLCLLILAKRQPLATDLRFITLAMKMVTDLERIGDLATNISERALALGGYAPEKSGPAISRMSEVVSALIRQAIAAFVAGDAESAQVVCDSDEEVDRLYVEACNVVHQRMARDLAFLDRGTHLMAVAKFLERIGDHVTNLAELVIFMVKGKDIRHLGSAVRAPSD